MNPARVGLPLAAAAALALVGPVPPSAARATPVAAASAAAPDPDQRIRWRDVSPRGDEQYRGLDAVSRRVAWVSGEEGGVLRTTNGGRTWQRVSPRGTRGMLFRDIEARDALHASVLAIGTGTDSRIYTTRNGGRTWRKAFVNRAPRAFYDCMAMWPNSRFGLAMSDPVGGKFRIIRTRDFGLTWKVVPNRRMPRAVDGEFGFAASGTCLEVAGKRRAWFGSGGAASRIFGTRDRGRSWFVRQAPIPAAEAGGVFSLAFKTVRRGVAVGGDFTDEDGRAPSGMTRRGGLSWITGGRTHGYRSGVDFVAGRPGVLLAVGPTGTDISHSGGRHWRHVHNRPYDGVDCTTGGWCWASGPDGNVGRLVMR